MEDHIFGTYATDPLKMLSERSRSQGVQHRSRLLPLDPAPNEPFTLLVSSGPEVAVTALTVCYTVDGSEPNAASPRQPFRRGEPQWHTPVWGYVTPWESRFEGLPAGTLLRYRILVHLQDGSERWADWPDPRRAIEAALIGDERQVLGGESEFALSIDDFAPPRWAQEALVYHIFLDRFARDSGGAWAAHDSLQAFYGGTLRGVTERLDHIASLGVSCLWLSPLFPSPSHHGYDATDYVTIEPRLGNEDDLRTLVREAHRRGIKLLLDFVANHVSNHHPLFEEAAPYDSPYHDWFTFDAALAPHGYRAFFNHAPMPQLNTETAAVREYLIEAACYWVREFDVDGFRLDYAHGPTHAFWVEFWRALKAVKPEVWCFGEIVEIPPVQRSYAGELDGLLDFQLSQALRELCAGDAPDLAKWVHFLDDHERYFPPHDRFSRPTFLDNHDGNRFMWLVGGNESRLRLAALLLYTLPNTPILYYGTEIGLSQRAGTDQLGLDAAREPMAWQRATDDNALLAYFRRLGALRQQYAAMRSPQRRPLHLSAKQLLLQLGTGDDALLLALNVADEPATVVSAALQGNFHALLNDAPCTLTGALRLSPWQGALLRPLHAQG